MSTGDWVPGNPNDRSIKGFCIRHGGANGPMSKTKFFALKKKKRGPRETQVNGTILIMPDAEAEWNRQNEQPTGALARLQKREAKWRLDRSKKAAQAKAEKAAAARARK